MHKYEKICNIYAIIHIHPTSMDLKRKYAKILVCKKYAIMCKIVILKFICKICRNLHSPLCSDASL